MKDKIKEIILSVNPGMDVEDEDFNIAEDMDSMDILALMEELEDAFDIEITMEEKNEERTDSRNRADFRRAESRIETGIHECGIFLQR